MLEKHFPFVSPCFLITRDAGDGGAVKGGTRQWQLAISVIAQGKQRIASGWGAFLQAVDQCGEAILHELRFALLRGSVK